MSTDDPAATYLVQDEFGEPIGLFQPDAIIDTGTKLAFALAAVCDDPEALERVRVDALTQVGPETFGYVAASALSVMAEHILAPAIDVALAHGTDLRPGLVAIAEGRTP